MMRGYAIQDLAACKHHLQYLVGSLVKCKRYVYCRQQRRHGVRKIMEAILLPATKTWGDSLAANFDTKYLDCNSQP